jgi:type IV pilus assembly protein PilQ
MVLLMIMLSSAPVARGQEGLPMGDLLRGLSRLASDEQGEESGSAKAAQGAAPVPGSEPEITISPTGTVDLHVAELPLSTVLQLLSLKGKRNIVASPNVAGSVTASLYHVTFDEALTAILASNGAGYIEEGSFIYIYTAEELAQMEAAASPPEVRVFPLSYITAADASTYITPILSEKGVVALPPNAERGVASSEDDAGGDLNSAQEFLIVRDLAPNLEEIAHVLAELDVRPPQVLIEATILRAQLNEDNALGIDFSVVGGVDLQMITSSAPAGQDLILGELPLDQIEEFATSASTGFTDNVGTGGLSLGIIRDQVGVFLRALESVTHTTVLANPKVLALNKQRGQVIVGRRDGFITTTVTETQAIQTVEFLETGTQLIYRPYIGRDGFVRVELHPEDSVGFVNAQGLPSEQTTEVTTNVVVKDGHTILIGGLFRDVTTDARSQVPVLGDVPGLGQLFRSNNDTIAREEVIILLTVHIVKDYEAYAQESMERFEDVERLRVGLREGMMWHGRERMAQSQYQRAVRAYGEGDNETALWYLNLALYNYGGFLPAIRLKEEIQGERAWDNDGSTCRGFLRRLLRRERGVDMLPYERPPASEIMPPGLRGPNGFSEASDES